MYTHNYTYRASHACSKSFKLNTFKPPPYVIIRSYLPPSSSCVHASASQGSSCCGGCIRGKPNLRCPRV